MKPPPRIYRSEAAPTTWPMPAGPWALNGSDKLHRTRDGDRTLCGRDVWAEREDAPEWATDGWGDVCQTCKRVWNKR